MQAPAFPKSSLGPVPAAVSLPAVEIRPVRLDDPVVAPLLASLGAEYEALYGEVDEMATTEPAHFDPPAGVFVSVIEETTEGPMLIAGGGFRPLSPGVCEVKRMWTHPDHRRRGLAAAVLGDLEDRARAAGYVTVRLETGPRQPAAAALYTSRGYRRIPPYGRYSVALAFELPLLS
jgi:GNAT superfamily N-acetyltransferase